jgi:hypothetical protein
MKRLFPLMLLLLPLVLAACGANLTTPTVAPTPTVNYCAFIIQNQRKVVHVAGPPSRRDGIIVVTTYDGHDLTYDGNTTFVCADTLEGVNP